MNCPNCQSIIVNRKKRSVFQKIILPNSKKLKCFSCATVFFYFPFFGKSIVPYKTKVNKQISNQNI